MVTRSGTLYHIILRSALYGASSKHHCGAAESSQTNFHTSPLKTKVTMSILTDDAMKVRLQLELIVHRNLHFSSKTKLWQDISLKEPQEQSLYCILITLLHSPDWVIVTYRVPVISNRRVLQGNKGAMFIFLNPLLIHNGLMTQSFLSYTQRVQLVRFSESDPVLISWPMENEMRFYQ